MAVSVYKWFGLSFLICFLQFDVQQYSQSGKSLIGAIYGRHPFYMSVVEINHNASEKRLEISCKIFTNDFEKTLENNYKSKIDLSSSKDKAAADRWINDYIKKHLFIKANSRDANFYYLGFEKEDDAIYSYFEVDSVSAVKKIDITNTLLHDFSNQQINIIHCMVGGKRQSSKLDYPNSTASFKW